MFVKNQVLPPWNLNTKITLVLPLKSAEENLQNLESSIVSILTEFIENKRDKFILPVRLADMQKEI